MNQITRDIYEGLEPWPLDLQGWHGDSPVFRKLIEEVRPTRIIEVGSWKGQSAINMAESVKTLGLDTEILCVDSFLGAAEMWSTLAHTPERDLMLKHGYPQVYYQFLSNVMLTGHRDIILPVPMPSTIAAKVLADGGIKAELIYIDASHDFADVLRDCQDFYKLLPKKGGVLFGDDFTGWPGVNKAVKEFAACIGKPIETIEDFWIIRA
jgi:hypothetical protein